MSFKITELKKSASSGSGADVTTYLSLGSNIGIRRLNLISAIEAIGFSPFIKVAEVSSFYESAPVDKHKGALFLNCAVKISSSLEPLELLDELEQIEKTLGRQHKGDNQPRIIDIDISLYGGMVVVLPRLQVPHPRMAERRFVMEPLAEISPNLMHPLLKKSAAEIAASLSTQRVHHLPV